MNKNLYIDFIRHTIENDGYQTADTVNKMAFSLKQITTSLYSEAARLIAAAYLERSAS